MIDARHLTRTFGKVTAVDDLSFQVERGEIFGLLGPNGAGKTTAMRMLCCLISPTSGNAFIGGLDVAKASDSLKIRRMIGLVPDNVGLYEELSAYENLDYYGKLYDCPEPARKKRMTSCLTLFGLWDKRDQPVGSFSKGMKQKLAVARALVHDPDVLFFDEPTANLDPESAKVVTDFIVGLKQQGKTTFLNTHNLAEAQQICDRVGILRAKLLALGSPAELRQTIWGSKTVIQLAAVTDSIVAAIRQLQPRNVAVDGLRIVVDVADPLRDNPDLAQAVVSAGGRIQFITSLGPDLEETYLRIVKGAALGAQE